MLHPYLQKIPRILASGKLTKLSFGLWLLLLGMTAQAQLIANGSFEHAVTGAGLAPAHWKVHFGSPDIQAIDGNGTGIYALEAAPAQGATYLGLLATGAMPGEAIGQAVALRAHTDYSGHIQMFVGRHHPAWDGDAVLQVLAASDQHGDLELLWESQPVENEGAWREYSIHFLPQADYEYVVLQVALADPNDNYAYLLIDDFELNQTLPVTLRSFTATSAENQVNLFWETDPSLAGQTYSPEWAFAHSPNDFVALETIIARPNQQEFSAHHILPPNGDLLYRLRIRNENGAINFSEIARISREHSPQISVCPNPSQGVLYIRSNAESNHPLSVRVFDLNGQQLLNTNLPASQTLDLRGIVAPGVYLIDIAQGKLHHRERLLLQ